MVDVYIDHAVDGDVGRVGLFRRNVRECPPGQDLCLVRRVWQLHRAGKFAFRVKAGKATLSIQIEDLEIGDAGQRELSVFQGGFCDLICPGYFQEALYRRHPLWERQAALDKDLEVPRPLAVLRRDCFAVQIHRFLRMSRNYALV